MSAEAFLTLHRNLPREGPGEAADIEWLGDQVALPENALICDLACGPGADIGALLELAPGASVVAIDHHPQFVGQAAERWTGNPNVDLRLADMSEPGGRYDLIWCAGGVYLMGVERALATWRPFLAQGGVIAFSEPCFWRMPPPGPVAQLFADYPDMSDAAGIEARVRAAGYETVATRRLGDAAWNAYYSPMLERMSELYGEADGDLRQVLAQAAAEIAIWNAHGDDFGYLLSVVRPA